MARLREIRRPGATISGCLTASFGVVQVMKGLDWPYPTTWTRGIGVLAYVADAAAATAAGLLVAFGFRRSLARQNSLDRYLTAAQGFAQVVIRTTGLQPDDFGVNIWVVRGMKGFRRLARVASVTGKPRSETPVTWIKGKGVIGEAWARGRSRFADLEHLRRVVPTQEIYESLPRDERFRLTWDEFQQTRRYQSVLAVPLRRHRYARHVVRGVVAIDVLTPGRGLAIEGIQETTDFGSIVRTCEAVLVGES